VKLVLPTAGLALACLILCMPALAEDGEMVTAPLPPIRPFDLDLPPSGKMPSIVVPARPALASVVAPPPRPAEPAGSAPLAAPPTPGNEADGDEEEGVEWPKLTPGQKAGAEPQFDPNEKADKPGISTDPGTSIACLPEALKGILEKVAARYGAVKVTSTWRPAWRARRNSYHRRCEAMDFRVPGVRPRIVLDYARELPNAGGNKVYWNGLIHIDTGPRRAW
jgi:hypothetical protein